MPGAQQALFREHDRFLDLALRDGPVAPQQPRLFFLGHQPEAATLVEAHRPGRRFPRAHEERPIGLALEVLQQASSDAATLLGGERVRVSNERDVGHGLKPHYADHAALAPDAKKSHACAHLGTQLLARHVRLVPAIGGNDSAIGERSVVDDGKDLFGIVDRLDYLSALRRRMKTRLPSYSGPFPR